VITLTVLMVFQGINGVLGGGAFILDPSGDLLGITATVLDGSPFPNFLVPGLVLFALLGIVPLTVAYALWAKPRWDAAAAIERRTGMHWAWLATVSVSAALLVFLAIELLIVGYTFLLLIMSVVGVGMLALAMLPATRQHYA
jgi:hypothetical protein